MAEKLRLKTKATKVFDFKKIDYSSAIPKFEADYAKMEQDINRAQYANGIHEKVDEIKTGDLVELSCQSSVKQFQRESIFVYVGRNLYSKELEEKLVGLKRGEEKELTVAGNSVLVKVLDIVRIVIPELTDENVSGWGMEGVSTVQDLKLYYIGRQIDAFMETDEEADMMTSFINCESVKLCEFEYDEYEKERIQAVIEQRVSEVANVIAESGDGEVDMEKLIESMLFGSLQAAVIGEKILEEQDGLLDSDDYEHEIKNRAVLLNVSEEEARAGYSVLDYTMDAYSMFYFDLIEEYVGEVLHEKYMVLDEKPSVYDVAIVGAGPAGLSAALTLKLHNKTIIWFGTDKLSDKVEKSEKIANYPGVAKVSGTKLNEMFREQMAEMNLTLTDKMVTTISPMKGQFMLLADNEIYQAKTVLLSTGAVSAKGYDNEERLLGHGVSYCATCDGFLYEGKTIAVFCGSKRYEHEVAYLAEIAKEVKLVVGYPDCELDLPNVTKVKGPIKSVKGESKVEGIVLSDGTEIPVDGFFVLRTSVAPTSLLSGLEMEGPHIAINRMTETNIPGCFAAGDCTGRPYQITKATGEGNIAAHQIVEYLSCK